MKKVFLIFSALLVLLGSIFLYQYIAFNDKKLHITICDVGQGDAIFIRTAGGLDILIDGGPDDSVLNCLGKHMPFWDKTLELLIVTHPHADHFVGLFSVLKNYKVKSFALENLNNKTIGFSSFMDRIKAQNIPTRFVFAGDRFVLKDGVILEILGPTQEFLDLTSPEGTIGESSEFASLIIHISFGEFDLLLTGDSQAEGIRGAIKNYSVKDIDILQVPHHGSKSGLSKEILEILNPKVAAISVGKNKYGHPTGFILDLLKSTYIKTLRTDENEEIEIVSNGKIFKAN